MGNLVYHDDKRGSGRLDVDGINSVSKGTSFGEVINLSANGLLIMRRKRMKFAEYERFSVQLGADHLTLDVSIKVAWEKRIGFRKWLYGFSFCDMPDRDQMIIKKMAMQAGAKRCDRKSPLKVAG